MDREQMLNVMRQGYAARVRGDVDGILTIFTQDAKFKLNAAPASRLWRMPPRASAACATL